MAQSLEVQEIGVNADPDDFGKFMLQLRQYESKMHFPARPATIIKAVTNLVNIDPVTSLRMVNHGVLRSSIFHPDARIPSYTKPGGIIAFDDVSFEAILFFCRAYRQGIVNRLGVTIQPTQELTLTHENSPVMLEVSRHSLVVSTRKLFEQAQLPNHAGKLHDPQLRTKTFGDKESTTGVAATPVRQPNNENTPANPLERLRGFLIRFDNGTIKELGRCGIEQIELLRRRLDGLDKLSRTGVLDFGALEISEQDDKSRKITERRAFLDAIVAIAMFRKFVREGQSLDFNPGAIPTYITVHSLCIQTMDVLRDFHGVVKGEKSKQPIAMSLGYALGLILERLS